MAKKKGRQLLVKIRPIAGGDAAARVIICGLTTKTLTLNNEEVDVTTANCDAPDGPLWTEVLDGVRRVSLSGNGLSKQDGAEAALTAIALSDTPIANMEVIVPNFGTFIADFFIQSLEFGGEQSGGVTFSLTAASSGAVQFTAAAPAS